MDLLFSRFSKYLNWDDEEAPTSEMGLIENAPQEAIDAYEEYIKLEKESDPEILI
jgi:hypothetical protein